MTELIRPCPAISTEASLRRVGVDEAGRGPVIGPMVIAICALTDKDKRWCAEHNVTDSKLIAPAKRDKLADALKQRCWHAMAVIHPPEIDAAVRDRKVTLNGLEIKYMAELIKLFYQTYPETPAEIMIDAPVRKTMPFRRLLAYLSSWPDINTLKAENRADLSYRHVGAASIIAKAQRELLMRELRDELKQDIGCGYAHDPLSVAYVKSAKPGDPYIRWSWMTCRQRAAPEDHMNALL